MVENKSISKISGSPISVPQLRAARALLGWSQDELAERSGVSKPTIARLELGDGLIGGYAATKDKLQHALETSGIEFIDENGSGLGVRLRHFVHTEKGTERLLFRRRAAPIPSGKWLNERPILSLPRFAKLNNEGWFIWPEPTKEERERALRWYGASIADVRPKGPATDVVEAMDVAIDKDKAKKRSR